MSCLDRLAQTEYYNHHNSKLVNTKKILVRPSIYPASEHEIDYHLIDPDALWIVRRLREAGFEAYIVGGSIRDMLAKRVPKDFDISTSALPEEIKKVFGRRCILIGRRFRLAHIRFSHHKYIEVSTFRSGENEGDLIVRDNQWGTADEDVLRRDFTINGLFYDPEEHVVIDYVGGWEDAHKKLIRSIGDPVIRFRQDPVRMIRLLKFQARFEFDIDPTAVQAIEECRQELRKSAPARILEEMLRMLESGYSARFVELLHKWGFLELIFPSLTQFYESNEGKKITQFLEVADTLNQKAKNHTLDRAILASCLLFPILEQEIEREYTAKGITPNIGEVLLTTNSVIQAFVTASFSHFPRKLSTTMSLILSNQYRLTPLNEKRPPKHKLMRHKEFILSLVMLKMRSLVDPSLADDYASWKETYKQHHDKHGSHPQRSAPPKKRGRRKPRSPNARPSS